MAVRKAVEELDEDAGLNDLVRHNRLQSLYFLYSSEIDRQSMCSVRVMELLVIRCYLAHHYIATEEMSVSDSLDNYPAYLGRVFFIQRDQTEVCTNTRLIQLFHFQAP